MSSTAATPAPPEATNRRRMRTISIAIGLVLAAICGTVLALATGSSTPTAPSTFAPALNKDVPASVEDLPLVNEHGATTDLAAFRGRVVVLADFLTSCQDECPISTGAFLTLQHQLDTDGLAGKVAIVEVTVDPGRDSPARLEAYERYTGVDWTLLTANAEQIAAFWKFFGAEYDIVKDSPTDTSAVDWETGKRYTYDVDHSNLVYVIDAEGHPRLITEGLPSVGKVLPPKLESLLSPLGKDHLAHPGFGAWTEPGLADAVGSVLGRSIPGA